MEGRDPGVRKGDRINELWVIEASLGRGGMGSVYRCHHRDSERIVAAIKVLAGELRGDGDARARFLREAEILHRLDHPAVVKVLGVRVDADPPYLEMEYVRGEPLCDLLEGGAPPPARAVELARQVFEALAYLHAHDVRHRDLKPDNVLVREDTGEVVLVDFGLALDAAVSRLTTDNIAFGTVAYAPPEWLRPGSLDPAAWDLYAGGVMLWELLTGEEPFPASGEGAPRQQALQIMLSKQAAPPLDPGPAFPSALRGLVRELTDPEPSHRPKTAEQVLERLRPVEAALAAGWAPEPGGDLSTVDSAQLPTQVPPPFRVSSERAAAPDRAPPSALSETGRNLAAAVLGTALVSAVGFGAYTLGAQWSDRTVVVAAAPTGVDVVVSMPEVAFEHLSIALDGRLPVSVAPGELWFEDVPVGTRTIQWAYGDGCTLSACPGEACASWCGADLVVVNVPDEDPARIELPFQVPRREVAVLVRSLETPRKPKRGNAPLKPWGYLAAIEGRADGPNLRFAAVPPGEHSLLVALGACPAGAAKAGCTRDGTCPEGCASERRTVKVPWDSGPLVLTSDLPAPQ